MKPFLSACLIVKNEEDMLRRCLQSLQGEVDEIVIVDTGSTDTTKEIAKEFTEKVYDFKWIDDFAAARNAAASYATGEWILAIDADECVDLENLKAAIEEIKSHNNKYDAYAVEIQSFTDELGEEVSINRMARIYRNDNTIRYEGAIHEQFVNKEGQQQLALLSLKVYHYGYLKYVVQKQNKRTRNMTIVKKMLKTEKDKGFAYFNYGQELRSLEKTKEALDAFLTAFKHKESVYQNWVGRCLYFIVESLAVLKRYEEALTIINDAEEVFPAAPDFPFWRGEIYFAQKRFDDAKEVYTNIIMNRDKYKDIIFQAGSQAVLPYTRLAQISEYEKQDLEALKYYSEVLNESGLSVKAVVKSIELLSKYHTPEEIFEFVETRCLIKNDEVRMEVLKDILNCGLGELTLLLTKSFARQNEPIVRALQLKAKMVNGSSILEFATEELAYGIQKKVFDGADLIVLYEMTKDIRVQNLLEKSKLKHVFFSLFDESRRSKKMKQDEYLSILEKSLRFQKPEFAERLVSYASIFSKQVYAKIADVFYMNGYEEIGMDFYMKVDRNCVTKRGYENIIEWLIFKKNIEEACSIAIEAVHKFKKDFRFYKYAIELGGIEVDMVMKKGLREFSDSKWLQKKQGLYV